jgi:hypothetical protein
MPPIKVDSEAINDAVATSSRYIQFDTTNPPGNEMQAAQWFRDQPIQRGIGPMILEKQDINRTHGIDERISIENIMLGIKMTRDIIHELCVDK